MAPKRDTPSLFTPAPLPVAALSDAERVACLRLIRSGHVGPVTFRELINHFGGARQALDALPDLLKRRRRDQGAKIPSEADAYRELDRAERIGAVPIFTIEPNYPPALAVIDVPPPLIYAKGFIEALAKPAIGIVGSRASSAAGIALARQLASELAAQGLIVVSGLARGVDGAAHEASLASGTVAVLAGGLDIIYPPEHEGLSRRLCERGALLSEQPPGFVPRAKDFPRRNRLISGMALGVVVVEAAKRSGTLVTARFAAEQGREVMAVPGHPLDPRAEGTNDLLKQGATLVTSATDVIAVVAPMIEGGLAAGRLGPLPRPPSFEEDGFEEVGTPLVAASAHSSRAASGSTDAILELLGPNPVDINELARAAGVSASETRIALLELDLQGAIVRHGSHLVSRAVTGDAPLRA